MKPGETQLGVILIYCFQQSCSSLHALVDLSSKGVIHPAQVSVQIWVELLSLVLESRDCVAVAS